MVFVGGGGGGGGGTGWTTSVATLYTAEVSPSHLRGHLVALHSVLITAGRASGALASALVFSSAGSGRPAGAAIGRRPRWTTPELDFSGRRSAPRSLPMCHHSFCTSSTRFRLTLFRFRAMVPHLWLFTRLPFFATSGDVDYFAFKTGAVLEMRDLNSTW